MVRLRHVIEADEHFGCGTVDDPHRTVKHFYDLDGTLLWSEPDRYSTARQARLAAVQDNPATDSLIMA